MIPATARHPGYINCDWAESCTAITEHHDGRFKIITWSDAAMAAEPLDLAEVA